MGANEDLVARYQAGDRAALGTLVHLNDAIAWGIARKYARLGPLLDLVQEARCGLIIAARKWDAARGGSYATVAYWWARGLVTRSIVGEHGASPARAFWRCGRAREAALAAGAAFTPEYLAEFAGVPVAAARAAHARYVGFAPTQRVVKDTGDLVDIPEMADPAPGADERLVAEETAGRVRAAVEALRDVRQRDVVRSRWLADEPETLEQVGRRWGVSRERVRQIEAKAMGRLKQVLAEAAS